MLIGSFLKEYKVDKFNHLPKEAREAIANYIIRRYREEYETNLAIPIPWHDVRNDAVPYDETTTPDDIREEVVQPIDLSADSIFIWGDNDERLQEPTPEEAKNARSWQTEVVERLRAPNILEALRKRRDVKE